MNFPRNAPLYVVCALLFAAATPALAAQGAVGISGGGNSYECPTDAATGKSTGTCTCQGFFDCKRMVDAGVCTIPKGKELADIMLCQSDGWCTCAHSDSAGIIAPNNLITVAPMGTKLAPKSSPRTK